VCRPEKKKTVPIFRIYEQTQKRKPFSYSGSVSRPENKENLSHVQDLCADQKTLKTFPEFTPQLFFYFLLPPIILGRVLTLF
jgi:hypothetical protein